MLKSTLLSLLRLRNDDLNEFNLRVTFVYVLNV